MVLREVTIVPFYYFFFFIWSPYFRRLFVFDRHRPSTPCLTIAVFIPIMKKCCFLLYKSAKICVHNLVILFYMPGPYTLCARRINRLPGAYRVNFSYWENDNGDSFIAKWIKGLYITRITCVCLRSYRDSSMALDVK